MKGFGIMKTSDLVLVPYPSNVDLSLKDFNLKTKDVVST